MSDPESIPGDDLSSPESRLIEFFAASERLLADHSVEQVVALLLLQEGREHLDKAAISDALRELHHALDAELLPSELVVH